jgi:hypothetical protein
VGETSAVNSSSGADQAPQPASKSSHGEKIHTRFDAFGVLSPEGELFNVESSVAMSVSNIALARLAQAALSAGSSASRYAEMVTRC